MSTTRSIRPPTDAEAVGSEAFASDNLLDRHTAPRTLAHHYDYFAVREREILSTRLGIDHGDVLSVGCGWHPGRHLFPAPDFRITAADVDGACVDWATRSGQADAALLGRAGRLDLEPRSFDIVLYRLVMHHIAYREPLDACFAEAARLLRDGGALVVIEPSLWHPLGLALSVANRLGVATAVHGTPDDIPLSPAHLQRLARAAGLRTELHAVTFGWRRLPIRLQRLVHDLDGAGSRSRLAPLGHTLLLIARQGSRAGPVRSAR